MAAEDFQTPGDDQPKDNPWRHDRLGYAPFCERLANVFINMRAPNGYVVGLHGEWGSGKSTAINFVLAFLNKHNQETSIELEKITIVDFRPWIVSGHQDLIAAFFKIMTESMAPRPSWIKQQWRRSLRLLKIGGDPLLDAVATVAVTIDPSVGAATKAAAPVAKKSLGAMIDKFLAEPSLQAAYEKLKNLLKENKKRFLVIIDDLDRLQDDEIRSIMQMVKTVGRLPNVTYVLAYDRSIVWQALKSSDNHDRPHFAEKIVQQEIELPKPIKESLLSILDGETHFLIGATADSVRWHYIVRDGVRRWIRNARDVQRLSNAVKFSWPALQGEIDPQDLMAMEGMRLFDPIAFEWVRANRDFLFSDGRFTMSSEDVCKEEITILKKSLPEGIRDQIVVILTVLFPHQAKHFEENSYSSAEYHSSVVKRRGIGCEAGYDAYFGLRISVDAIPKAVIDHIVSAKNETDSIVIAAAPFVSKTRRNRQPMIGLLLEEVRYRFEGQGAEAPTQGILDAIFHLGDDILRTDYRGDLFTISPRSQLQSLVSTLLESWGISKAGKHLIEAFRNSPSIAFNADIFVERARELRLLPSEDHSSALITEIDLNALGTILLQQIETNSANGTLSNAPFYWDIARSWKHLDGPTAAKNWISSMVGISADFLARLTRGFVSHSISSEARSYNMTERPDPELYDLEVILKACQKHLGGDELNEDERARIQVVATAIKKMLKQTTDTT